MKRSLCLLPRSPSPTWMASMLRCTYRDQHRELIRAKRRSAVSRLLHRAAARLIPSDSQHIHKDPIAADTLWSQSHFSYSLAGWSSRTCQIRSPQCISACVGTMKRGSELSCNVLIWVNVDKEIVCAKCGGVLKINLSLSACELWAWAFTPFDDLLLGLYGWPPTMYPS